MIRSLTTARQRMLCASILLLAGWGCTTTTLVTDGSGSTAGVSHSTGGLGSGSSAGQTGSPKGDTGKGGGGAVSGTTSTSGPTGSTGGSGTSGTTGSTGTSGGTGTTGTTGTSGTTGSTGGSGSSTSGGKGGSTTGGKGGNVSGSGGIGGSSGGNTCPSPALKAGDTTKTIQVDSKSRTYILHVPSTYDGSKPAPLVVDFHPLGGSGPAERTGSPYPAQTDPEGVIMAFPTGLSGPSGGAWNVGPCCVKDTDDLAFAKALVADVQKSACIDPKRIYAVGFSMGGGMSHYVACHAADVFAAVAPAAFDLLGENVDGCKPTRPISVISFRGTGDSVVVYGGGSSSAVAGMPVTFLGAKGTFEKWAKINECSGTASAEDKNGCSSYSGCKGDVEVMLCTKQGGGHEAGNASVGWPALKRHTMP